MELEITIYREMKNISNKRGARWPLPHHYSTHTTNYIHRDRSGQIELARRMVATSSSILNLHREIYIVKWNT